MRRQPVRCPLNLRCNLHPYRILCHVPLPVVNKNNNSIQCFETKSSSISSFNSMFYFAQFTRLHFTVYKKNCFFWIGQCRKVGSGVRTKRGTIFALTTQNLKKLSLHNPTAKQSSIREPQTYWAVLFLKHLGVTLKLTSKWMHTNSILPVHSHCMLSVSFAHTVRALHDACRPTLYPDCSTPLRHGGALN